MSDGPVLVIDAGSSRLRCHLFDSDGQIVSTSAAEWPYLDEPDASSLAKAFDIRLLWQAVAKAIKQCVHDAPAHVGTVACVAVTSQRQAVVFMDSNNDEIYAGPNMDLRAVFEGAAIDESHREQVYAVTGHVPSFLFAPAKLRWFQEQQPDAYARIANVLTLADWIAWRLTGVLTNEITLAGEAGLLDINGRHWCNGLLGELGLDQQPNRLVNTADIVGRVIPDVALQLGFEKNVPVTITGADSQCGLLGMGVAQPGHISIVAGWSAPVQMVTARPTFSKQGRTWAGCHLLSDLWVAESSAGATGSAYQWLADTMYGDTKDPFAKMSSEAAEAAPGSNGAVSMMGNGAMNMSALGMTYGGIMFPVPLTSATGIIDRGHLTRAALESTACAIRANIEQLEALTGDTAKTISLGGGMTRSELFERILVDILGRDILVAPVPDVTALGAYLCGRVAIGDFGSLSEAAKWASSMMRPLKANVSDAAEYEEFYQDWTRLSDLLGQIEL